MTVIGPEAFAFNKLTSLSIPGNVKLISNNAFWCNYNLEHIALSEGTIFIASGAFHTCELTEITLPSSITTVGPEAFGGRGNKITSVTINGDDVLLHVSSFGNFPMSRYYYANDNKPGTYTWDGENCFFNV
jgi:hypothetical protein